MGTHLNLVKRQSVYHLDRKIQFSWSVFNLLFANVSECLHKSATSYCTKINTGSAWKLQRPHLVGDSTNHR